MNGIEYEFLWARKPQQTNLGGEKSRYCGCPTTLLDAGVGSRMRARGFVGSQLGRKLHCRISATRRLINTWATGCKALDITEWVDRCWSGRWHLPESVGLEVNVVLGTLKEGLALKKQNGPQGNFDESGWPPIENPDFGDGVRSGCQSGPSIGVIEVVRILLKRVVPRSHGATSLHMSHRSCCFSVLFVLPLLGVPTLSLAPLLRGLLSCMPLSLRCL